MNDVGITLKENAKTGFGETDRACDSANVWHRTTAIRAARRASGYRSTSAPRAHDDIPRRQKNGPRQ
ncbi:protein of unknown function (plasmid) [Caballeronia sp. S22]